LTTAGSSWTTTLKKTLEKNASREGRVDEVDEFFVKLCLDFFLGIETSASVVDIVCFMVESIVRS